MAVTNGLPTSNTQALEAPSPYSFAFTNEPGEIEDIWRKLEQQQTATAYQSYPWVRAALETFDKENKALITIAMKSGEPFMVLPLVLIKGYPSRLRWPGDSHCNIGCGLFSKDYLEKPDKEFVEQLLEALREKIEGPVVLHLKNQPETLSGFSNPLMALDHQIGPDPLYDVDISLGFEDVLGQGNGARKKKTIRRQARKAEQAGGYELVVPESKEEIEATLDLFFKLKSERLKELGVADVFESPQVHAFKRALSLHKENNGDRPLAFYVLKVGGKPRAMYGVSLIGKRCFSCINAVSYDDFSHASPGDMILYLMIEDLTRKGFEYFDIGIGQERYKTSWCKEPSPLMETVLPLGRAASAYAALMRYKTHVKQQIKSSDILWSGVKKIRKLKGIAG